MKGDLAFIAHQYDGFTILNISNPNDSEIITHFMHEELYETRMLDVKGNFVFLACGVDGIASINITEPANPELLDIFDTPRVAYDIIVDGDVAFLAGYNQGLQVYNISDPSDIKFINNYSNGSTYYYRLEKAGNYIYASCCFSNTSCRGINFIELSKTILSNYCYTIFYGF